MSIQFQHSLFILTPVFESTFRTKNAHYAQKKRVFLAADLQYQAFDRVSYCLTPWKDSVRGDFFLKKGFMDGLYASNTHIDLPFGEHAEMKIHDVAYGDSREVEFIRVYNVYIKRTIFKALSNFHFAQGIHAHPYLSDEALSGVDQRDQEPGRAQGQIRPWHGTIHRIETQTIRNGTAEKDGVQIALTPSYKIGSLLRQNIFEGRKNDVLALPDDGENLFYQIGRTKNSYFHACSPSIRLFYVYLLSKYYKRICTFCQQRKFHV